MKDLGTSQTHRGERWVVSHGPGWTVIKIFFILLTQFVLRFRRTTPAPLRILFSRELLILINFARTGLRHYTKRLTTEKSTAWSRYFNAGPMWITKMAKDGHRCMQPCVAKVYNALNFSFGEEQMWRRKRTMDFHRWQSPRNKKTQKW